MAVKIISGPPAYNKPPAPDKIPPKNIYPFPPMIMEETQVWVSVPQPDKLHIVGPLLPEHFAEFYKPHGPEDYGPMIMSALASGGAGKVLKSFYEKNTGIFKTVQIAVGSTGEPVFFKQGFVKKVHSLTIHANPRALGQEGIFELLDRLHNATKGAFKVGAFLATARISRLDIAVDVVGLRVADLLVSAKGEGKRAHYYGKGGELETINVHLVHKPGKTGKPTPKMKRTPMNDLLVMVYDKRSERIAKGHPPPFGEAPVTRIEVPKIQFGNKAFGFSSLLTWSNPIAGIRVGLIRCAIGEPTVDWLRYAEARRGGGPTRAASVCALTPLEAEELEQLYIGHKSDVLDVKSIWKSWPTGISHSGLSYLIEAAEQKSDGVPFPPEEI
jgi:hypothetical protein